MLRYRINYNLIIGLFIGSIVLAVGLFGLWYWQVNRKAGHFQHRAEQALAQGDPVEAVDYYSKYLQLRPDEDEARVEAGRTAMKVMDYEGATSEDSQFAFAFLQDAVRRTNNSELRKDLAKLIINFRPQDALGHLEDLREEPEYENDPEVTTLYARALFLTSNRQALKIAASLIGYDLDTHTWDENWNGPGLPEIHGMVASELYSDEREREHARDVVDRMVEINPESHVAYLQKSIFLNRDGDKEAATEALEKAYELAPDDVMVLSRKASMAYADEDYDLAKELYDEALEKQPENVNFYNMLATIEIAKENYDEALDILERGIREFTSKRAYMLVLFKIDVLFQLDDIAGVKEEIDRLVNTNNEALKPLIDFERARIKMEESRWSEAARDLVRIRPLLMNTGALPSIDLTKKRAMAGNLLARCYERLGKIDLAIQTYNLVLSDMPNFAPAAAAKARLEERLGVNQTPENLGFAKMIEEMLSRPEHEQDWEAIDQYIADLAERNKFSEAEVKLAHAEVAMKRGSPEKSRKLIREAAELEPDNKDVRFAAVSLLAQEPEDGPVKALKLLDILEDRWGVSVRSRTKRADLFAKINDEDVVDQMHALSEGIESWPESDRAQLLTTLGLRFQELGYGEEARDYVGRAVQLLPNNLPLRTHLFGMALESGDERLMDRTQAEILELVGSEDDASYIATEVRRRIYEAQHGAEDNTRLQEARQMLDKALQTRETWHELHLLYAQLLLMMQQDIDVALARLNDALRYGPMNVKAIGLQVQLLAARGQHEVAYEKMQQLPEDIRTRTLGRVEAQLLLIHGEQEAAFESAKEVSALKPDDAGTLSWFASIAHQTEHFEEAIDALRKASQLQPTEINHWIKLVQLYGEQEEYDKLEEVLREAHLSLDAEFLAPMTAKYFELLGRWQSAEDIYLATYRDREDELPVARELAKFYLNWTRAESENQLRAGSYLNQILRQAYQGIEPKDNEHVVWARRQAAKLLSSSGDYQDSLKAQQLLMQGAEGGRLSVDDERLLAEILASRRDPQSLLEAIDTLSRLQKENHLGKQGVVILARLLGQTQQWEKAENILVDALIKYRDDETIWASYIEMLLDQGAYGKAENRIGRLRDLNPRGAQYRQLAARLAAETGKQNELRKMLQSMLPQSQGALSEQQLSNILGVANMATEFEDYEVAEKLYRLYVSRKPERMFELTSFLALHGDAEEAMDQMKRQFNNNMESVLRLAGNMLRDRRDEFGDKFDADIDRMVRSALRDDPESIRRMLFKAEILDAQEKYEESTRTYDQLLSRNDLPVRFRAAAQNNLGFQLALLETRLDEAESLVNEAMETFGPVADMLDTRAVVRIARGDYQGAIEDMQLALSVADDPVKHYHYAKAQLLAGNVQAALRAWEDALQTGLEVAKLPKLERKEFAKIKQQIEAAATQNASL